MGKEVVTLSGVRTLRGDLLVERRDRALPLEPGREREVHSMLRGLVLVLSVDRGSVSVISRGVGRFGGRGVSEIHVSERAL